MTNNTRSLGSPLLKKLLPFTLVTTLAHLAIVYGMGMQEKLYYSLWSVWCFNIIATALFSWALLVVRKKNYNYLGITFMAGTMIKMFGAVIFLLPHLLEGGEHLFRDALSFLLPYLAFMAFDILFSLGLLKERP